MICKPQPWEHSYVSNLPEEEMVKILAAKGEENWELVNVQRYETFRGGAKTIEFYLAFKRPKEQS